jgi:hypothetical protein
VKRYEKVEGVPGLYIDHKRKGSPYLYRYKLGSYPRGQPDRREQHEIALTAETLEEAIHQAAELRAARSDRIQLPWTFATSMLERLVDERIEAALKKRGL